MLQLQLLSKPCGIMKIMHSGWAMRFGCSSLLWCKEQLEKLTIEWFMQLQVIKTDLSSTLRRSETWSCWELTCCSVKDLGLKEDAGVLISNAGHEQPFSLDWTSWHNHLSKGNHMLHLFTIKEEQSRQNRLKKSCESCVTPLLMILDWSVSATFSAHRMTKHVYHTVRGIRTGHSWKTLYIFAKWKLGWHFRHFWAVKSLNSNPGFSESEGYIDPLTLTQTWDHSCISH